MKKVLVLFGMIALAQTASFAFMNEGSTSDIEILRAQGYSDSFLRAVDVVNDINKGESAVKSYKRYFTPKRTNKLGRGYTALKRYIDPIQDDDKFLEHQIEFTNTWQGDQPFYSTGLKPGRQKIENL